jgi:N-acetyl-anhydromuramyl-L-alanine amidase AmpD
MLAYYPDARRFPSPNYTEGNRGRRAVVVHIAGGGWAGTLSWLRNPASTASSHLVIGEDGAVAQLVSFDDSAWTNGLTWKAGRWRNARGKVVLSTWRLLEAPINPNLQTITIELVGVHTKPRPEQQRRALVTVLVWLAQQLGWASYEVGETLIGHYHLDPVDRPRCPGPHVDLETIAALANPALLPPIPPAPPARS